MLFFRYLLIAAVQIQKIILNLSLVMFTKYQVVITALNAPIVDRAGRKPLLLVNKMSLEKILTGNKLTPRSCGRFLQQG
jgi:hypothetical protein